MHKEQKVWEDQDGKTYSNEKLIELQKSWSLSTWEEFLKQDVEGKRQESLLENPDCLENYSKGFNEIVQEEGEREMQFPYMQLQIRAYITRLTAMEQRVVRYLFWDGLSQRHTAEKCKVSRTAIVSSRDRALKKLGEYFIEDLARKTKLKNIQIEEKRGSL